MPSVTIGDNCIIGAGVIVTKDVPSGSVGVPVHIITTIRSLANKCLAEAPDWDEVTIKTTRK